MLNGPILQEENLDNPNKHPVDGVSSAEGDAGVSSLEKNRKVTYKSRGKKKRAPRATKVEMDHRKKVVAGILKEKGDMTPKDLNPMVDEILGKPLEPHHLRAVLRRFSMLFENA